jgi:pimeloyl-ACP methyl ester carboxylesterase
MVEKAVWIPQPGVVLGGDLVVPPEARGVVLFAHGSGSSRFSPRNRYVAGVLRQHGCATLLFDLLTESESLVRARTFDIELLAGRLARTAEWARSQPELAALEFGYFGASTGAAAALVAAARYPGTVAAIVSRGGRPDLAAPYLEQVRVPTLLIVGGRDHGVLDYNRAALAQLGGPKELVVVPGATHLFEEPGALERVAELAAQWFERYLGGAQAAG